MIASFPRAVLAMGIVFAAALQSSAADAPQAASAAVTLPENVFASVPNDDVLDVVILGPERAAFVRYRVKYEGQGYRSAWYDAALRLYLYLDLNHDGMVSAAEAGRAPWTQILQGPFNNFGNQITKPGSYDPNRDGKVTFNEFVEYVRGSWSYDALAHRAGPPPDSRTDAVFDLLDHDGDKQLSAKELATTDACLRKCDHDEDELVSATELTPETNPFGNQFVNQNVGPGDLATIQAIGLTTELARSTAAQRIMKMYGKKGVAKNSEPLLPSTAIAGPATAFQAADANGDGVLSLDELRTRYMARLEPVFEMIFNANKPNQPVTKVELSARANAAAVPGFVAKPKGNGVVIEFDALEIEISSNDTIQNIASTYTQQFQNADADKNGTIDSKEARTNGFLQQLFLVADRDANGKLTMAELNAYAERVRDVAMSRMNLVVTDRGADLFQKLDANSDNQLSLRELRKAGDKLNPLDRNHDGMVAHGELPARYELSVGRNSNPNRGAVINRAARMNVRGATGPSSAPAWFVGMDRNGDGDVSPREFIGPMTVFREFDRDGDGLIDGEEASKIPDP